MEHNELIKYDGGLIKRVGNAIIVTNKLLALAEPQLIPYRKGDKWGFCTPDKKIVIECIYDDANPFIDGVARVYINEEHVRIDKKGNTLPKKSLKERIEEAKKSADLKAIEEANKGNGNNITPTEKTSKSENDNNVKRIIESIYDNSCDFSENLARVELKGKVGFITLTGELLIPCLYNDAEDFSDGKANVKLHGKWGQINNKGEQIIPCLYDNISPFSDGFVLAKLRRNKILIDKMGNKIYSFNDQLEMHGQFSDGFAMVEIKK